MKNITEKAQNLINGDREKSYGNYRKSFGNIAKIWSIILDKEVTPEQVGLCMIGLKLSRESYSHKEDNLIDIIGYVSLVERLYETKKQTTNK